MAATTALPRSAPERQGVRSGAILDFLNAAEREVHDLHSFILLRRGNVIAEGYWEPYGASHPHMLFSLSKSFTSTGIGMLVAEGRLSVDDLVLDLFPDEAPSEPSDHLRAMRVRHLLTMTTGHDVDPTRAVCQPGNVWTTAFLAQPVEHAPGTKFVYNSAATYLLSAIVQKITGQRLVQYLEPRLFAPLGIARPAWETSPQGIDIGGWGLSVTTDAIARFGQLYLQQGIWEGARLLPEAWVTAATTRQVPNGPSANPDWEQGYGYQFWRCRHGAYRGDGAFGQFCVVLPDQEAVIAITSGTGTMQVVLDLVWQHLQPAFGAERLPDDPAAQQALADRLTTLRLAPSAGQPHSSRGIGLSNREYVLADNPEGLRSIAFDFAADSTTLTLRSDHGTQHLRCGHERWIRGEVSLPRARETALAAAPPARVAASGSWRDDQTFVVDLCWYETPFRRTLTCHFTENRVTIEQQMNVTFGPTDPLRLTGRSD